MERLVTYLDTYRGRDKALRTTGYACWLVGGLSHNADTRRRMCTLASEFSSCRTVLRLFDDLSMLAYNRSYGLGTQESDGATRWLSVLVNCVDQLYYPVEHAAWAADRGLVPVDSSNWWYSSTFLWALSLYLNILRVIRSLFLLRVKLNACSRVGADRCLDGELRNLMVVQLLSLVEYCADLTNAIHWLPKRVMWSGKLKLWQVGSLGLISSLLGAYKMTRIG